MTEAEQKLENLGYHPLEEHEDRYIQYYTYLCDLRKITFVKFNTINADNTCHAEVSCYNHATKLYDLTADFDINLAKAIVERLEELSQQEGI